MQAKSRRPRVRTIVLQAPKLNRLRVQNDDRPIIFGHLLLLHQSQHNRDDNGSTSNRNQRQYEVNQDRQTKAVFLPSELQLSCSANFTCLPVHSDVNLRSYPINWHGDINIAYISE